MSLQLRYLGHIRIISAFDVLSAAVSGVNVKVSVFTFLRQDTWILDMGHSSQANEVLWLNSINFIKTEVLKIYQMENNSFLKKNQNN